MEITIRLPDNFSRLPESQKIKILTEEIKNIQSKSHTPKTKWAKFAQELKKKNLLSGAGDFVLKQSKELREDFAFKHDNQSK